VVDVVFESESRTPSEDVLIKVRLLVPVVGDVEAYVVRHGRVVWAAVKENCRTKTPVQYEICQDRCSNIDRMEFSVRKEMVDVICKVPGNLNNNTA
jgi:hypothetical protein